MGAKQSHNKARLADLGITDLAADKQPPTAASSTLAARSSASTSPALTSLSSTNGKLAQHAWQQPQQSRYAQPDTKAEDAVTEWKPDEEEKQREEDAAGEQTSAEDPFSKYRNGAASGRGGAAQRSGIVNGVKATSGGGQRQQPQLTMNAVADDEEEGVDDSGVSADVTAHHRPAAPSTLCVAHAVCLTAAVWCPVGVSAEGFHCWVKGGPRREHLAAASFAKRAWRQHVRNRLLTRSLSQLHWL